jgi:hypothetical protein
MDAKTAARFETMKLLGKLRQGDELPGWTVLRALKAMVEREWRPIETAPLDGTTVDCWVGSHRLENCFYGEPSHQCLSDYCDSCPPDLGVKKWRWSFSDEPVHPTHWMPHPAAPQ